MDRYKSLLLVVLVAAGLAVGAGSTTSASSPASPRTAGTAESLLARERAYVQRAVTSVAVRLPTRLGAIAPKAPTRLFASPLPAHQVFGFVPYGEFASVTPAELSATSVLIYNALDLQATGAIAKSGPGWANLVDPGFAGFVSAAHGVGDRVLLGVSSQSLPTIASLLRSPAKTAAVLASQLSSIIKSNGFGGIDLDIEGRATSQRARFAIFVATLATDLRHSVPATEIVVNTYPQSANNPADFFNVAALATHVDAFFVMAYDMVSAANASPNAPLASPILGLSDVQSLIAYTKVVNPRKLILGVPFYGYGFATTSARPGARTVRGAPLESLTYASIVTVGRQGRWDPASLTPFYVFKRGKTWRQTWFDNPVSVALKTALAAQLHLGGVGAWALGQEGPNTTMLAALDGGAAPRRLSLP